VPDGTVHAVDDQTGEVACGFDGELIEIEAAWDSPAIASVKCADCEQELHGESVSADERFDGEEIRDLLGPGPRSWMVVPDPRERSVAHFARIADGPTLRAALK